MLQKKPCIQSIMQKYLQQRETVGEAAADEEEEQEQEEEQQEDTEDSGGESGDDKCMVCGEKEEDDVKCVHSGYILSAYLWGQPTVRRKKRVGQAHSEEERSF